jgi:hypothetical protein
MTADEKAEFEKFKKRREDKRSKSPGPAKKGKGRAKDQRAKQRLR